MPRIYRIEDLKSRLKMYSFSSAIVEGLDPSEAGSDCAMVLCDRQCWNMTVHMRPRHTVPTYTLGVWFVHYGLVKEMMYHRNVWV